jgi:undecaprenyl-diphosphatase
VPDAPPQRYLHLERSPFEVRSALMLGAAALLLTGIGLLLALPLAGDAPAFDARLAAVATAPEDDAARQVAAAVGRVGHLVIVATIAVVVALVARWRSGRWDIGLLLAAVLGGATVVTGVLKALTDRARPDDTLTLSAAFPSGHTVRGAAVLGLVAWIVRQWSHHAAVRRLAVPVAVVLVVLNGVARVVLGVHWPTDVAAGFLIGAAWLLACCAVLRPQVSTPPR